jgi:hypothetical protein
MKFFESGAIMRTGWQGAVQTFTLAGMGLLVLTGCPSPEPNKSGAVVDPKTPAIETPADKAAQKDDPAAGEAQEHHGRRPD